MKEYLVYKESGEYDDYIRQNVYIIRNQADAKKFVVQKNEEEIILRKKYSEWKEKREKYMYDWIVSNPSPYLADKFFQIPAREKCGFSNQKDLDEYNKKVEFNEALEKRCEEYSVKQYDEEQKFLKEVLQATEKDIEMMNNFNEFYEWEYGYEEVEVLEVK